MKNQVTNGFDKMTPSNLLMKARFIISEMTINSSYFKTPDPSLADVQTAVNEFEAATMAAENRDRSAIAYRNEKGNVLIKMLRKLGVYVNLMSDGNRAIAKASGFDVAREPQPSPAITSVEPPVLSQGVSFGEIKSKSKRVPGARIYQFLITPTEGLPLSQWSQHSTTQSNFYFKNLDSGKRYFVRLCVVGTNNQIVYSEASSFVTQ